MRAVCLTFCLVVLAACASEPAPPSPEQAALFAQPVDAELVVVAKPNAMAFATTEITAPAGATVRLVMDNSATTSPAMLHNVVVLRAQGDIDRVGRAAAGAANHLPDDPAVLAGTPIAPPGSRTAVVFTMPPAGRYPFVCTYPGHYQFMRGTLVSTPG